jgi:hypothetical protein
MERFVVMSFKTSNVVCIISEVRAGQIFVCQVPLPNCSELLGILIYIMYSRLSWYVKITYRHVVWGDYRRGFGLNIGFIDHLYTRLGTTSSYSATTDLYNSQITTAPAKHFPFCCVFTVPLVTASNNGDS